MVARDDLHRLFDELVAFVFQPLSVTIFTRVHTTAEIVVLGRRGGRAKGSWSVVINVAQGGQSSTHRSPSAGTTSLILSFWLISSTRK